MYANCNMITLTTSDKILGFIKSVKDDEMKAIDAAITKSLGLDSGIKREEEKPVKGKDIMDFEAAQEVAEKMAEAKIYKELYENLLEKIIK